MKKVKLLMKSDKIGNQDQELATLFKVLLSDDYNDILKCNESIEVEFKLSGKQEHSFIYISQ